MRRYPSRAGMAILAAALAVSSSACSKTTLNGRVNVPGNEGGAIAVRVIPEKEIADYLAKKVPEALAALDERRTAFERLAKEQDTAIRDYQMASGASTSTSVTRDGVRVTSGKDAVAGDRQYTYDPAQHTQAEAEHLAREGLAEAEQQRAANTARFGAEKSTLADAMASGRTTKEAAGEWVTAWETDMLADVPQKGTVVYTDAKGAFNMKVPRGGKVALFASGDFRTGNRTFRRGWAVWVKADAGEKTVTLDENNMLLAEPSESVLK